jgi:adenylate kinase family enzyme
MTARRIAIWGNSASGKSTLAAQLSADLALPVFHVDTIAWRAGWRWNDETAFLEAQQQWIEQPAWIIDGVGHLSGLRRRFARADLIVFVDTPPGVCRARAQRRMDDEALGRNPFIAEGCRYSDVVKEQWQVIDQFERHVRGEVAAMLIHEFPSTRRLQLDGCKSTAELCAVVRAV